MSLSGSSEFARCPVCQARFRGVTTCSRCGANLAPLMLLITHAYALRQAARRGLQEGTEPAALAAAEAAQKLHATAYGDLLQLVCAALGGQVSHSSRFLQKRCV